MTAFFAFLPEDKSVSVETAHAWKENIGGKFSVSTVNVMLSAVNRFSAFMSWDIRIKQLKMQASSKYSEHFPERRNPVFKLFFVAMGNTG